VDRHWKHRKKGVEMLAQEAEVIEYYLRKWPQRKIATQLGIHPNQVARHIASAKQRWLTSIVHNFDQLRNEELSKIDLLEQTYWQAYEDSKTPLKTTLEIQRLRDAGTETTTAESHGDSRFLQGVERCIERRCKLLGLDAPTKIEQDVLIREYVGVSIDAVMGKARVIPKEEIASIQDGTYQSHPEA
jgi:hypothetical protein